MEIIFKKCNTCGNVLWEFGDRNLACCSKDMRTLKANEVDASFEKHIPNYKVIDNKIVIEVNHVMEDNHYIMWIMMVCDNEIYYKEFIPGERPIVTFDYKENATIYSYCNLTNMW